MICTSCFDIQWVCILPELCVYVFCTVLRINCDFFPLNSINRLALVMETPCVFSYIGTELLNIVTWSLTARIAAPEKRPLLDNESASNTGGTIGGGVFYAIRAGAIWEGRADKPSQSAVSQKSSFHVDIFFWPPHCQVLLLCWNIILAASLSSPPFMSKYYSGRLIIKSSFFVEILFWAPHCQVLLLCRNIVLAASLSSPPFMSKYCSGRLIIKSSLYVEILFWPLHYQVRSVSCDFPYMS
jgi:hypothetical protein